MTMRNGPVRRVLDTDIFDWLLLLSIVVALLLCPYSKVEESFNMQALHDILRYGPVQIFQYDHFEFPGVVPRSFLGALAISLIGSPIYFLGVRGLSLQILCRLVLGILCWLAFLVFRCGVAQKFGFRASQLLSLLVSASFHLPFYMTRTVPNTYALIGVLLSYGLWLRAERVSGMSAGLVALAVLSPFAVIFRCDMLALAVPWTFQLLASREIDFLLSLAVGLLMVAVSAALSASVDGWFWGKFLTNGWRGAAWHDWVWPEARVLLFNTVENKSSEWGTQPWHWYFTNAIPKSVHVWIMLAVLGLLGFRHPLYAIEDTHASPSDSDRVHRLGQTPPSSQTDLSNMASSSESGRNPSLLTLRFKDVVRYTHWPDNSRLYYYSLPALLFTVAYSFLPHKELRFVYPVALPVLYMCAAVGLDRLHRPDSEYSFLDACLLGNLVTHNHPSYRDKAKDGAEQTWRWNAKLSKRTSKNIFLYDIYMSLAVLGLLGVSLVLSSASLLASSRNYPGGVALHSLLYEIIPREISCDQGVERVSVHIDVLPAMTGVTRFLQAPEIPLSCGHPLIVDYSKDEDLYQGLQAGQMPSKSFDRFDYLLMDNSRVEAFLTRSSDFAVCSTVSSFQRFSLPDEDSATLKQLIKQIVLRPWTIVSVLRNIRIVSSPSVAILNRRNARDYGRDQADRIALERVSMEEKESRSEEEAERSEVYTSDTVNNLSGGDEF